jgi:hypothetical protein
MASFSLLRDSEAGFKYLIIFSKFDINFGNNIFKNMNLKQNYCKSFVVIHCKYCARPGRHSKAFKAKCLGPYTIIQRSKRIQLSNSRSKCQSTYQTAKTCQNFTRAETSPVPKPSLHLSMASSSVARATKIRRVKEIAQVAAAGKVEENLRRLQNKNKERDERVSNDTK